MRILAVSLLLLAPVLAIASDVPATGSADAKAAASAGVANARQKSGIKWADKAVDGHGGTMRAEAKADARSDKMDKVDKADADARSDRLKSKKKGETKAKPEPPVERTVSPPPPPTSADQSVCDLSPHPSWCDQ